MSTASSRDCPSSSSEGECDSIQPQEVTPELIASIVRQVEFYFSDANLPTDKKLLKLVKKDPEGFVPTKLFTNFRKVRALTKNVDVIATALQHSSLLQLTSDHQRVKRVAPVPDYDVDDIQRRTVVAQNLGDSPTIESVTELFSVYGAVKLVRICSKDCKGKLPLWLKAPCAHINVKHAYIEFEEESSAVLAAGALAVTDEDDEDQLCVQHLLHLVHQASQPMLSSRLRSSGGGSSQRSSRDVSPHHRAPRPAHNSTGPSSWSSYSRTGGGRQTSGGGAGCEDSLYRPPTYGRPDRGSVDGPASTTARTHAEAMCARRFVASDGGAAPCVNSLLCGPPSLPSPVSIANPECKSAPVAAAPHNPATQDSCQGLLGTSPPAPSLVCPTRKTLAPKFLISDPQQQRRVFEPCHMKRASSLEEPASGRTLPEPVPRMCGLSNPGVVANPACTPTPTPAQSAAAHAGGYVVSAYVCDNQSAEALGQLLKGLGCAAVCQVKPVVRPQPSWSPPASPPRTTGHMQSAAGARWRSGGGSDAGARSVQVPTVIIAKGPDGRPGFQGRRRAQVAA